MSFRFEPRARESPLPHAVDAGPARTLQKAVTACRRPRYTQAGTTVNRVHGRAPDRDDPAGPTRSDSLRFLN